MPQPLEAVGHVLACLLPCHRIASLRESSPPLLVYFDTESIAWMYMLLIDCVVRISGRSALGASPWLATGRSRVTGLQQKMGRLTIA